MNREEYNKKVLSISAYCSVQSKLLELYNPSYDNIAMLKEISPLATKAIRKKRKKNLKSLEGLSEELEKRISIFEKEKPEIAFSREARELEELLKQRKEEYKRLSNF
jgi:prephenate dehydrogenase|tara:strand:- start:1590 stop:1910 length:321 start_codon:yes stop_codon:yes gene_type:complete